MDLKVNSSISKVDYISRNGYSLKKNAMKRWVYKNNLTQPYMARKLHITVSEFKRKLKEREAFDEAQLRCLIYLMGAHSAFYVIYFHTFRERQSIHKEVFGKQGQ